MVVRNCLEQVVYLRNKLLAGEAKAKVLHVATVVCRASHWSTLVQQLAASAELLPRMRNIGSGTLIRISNYAFLRHGAILLTDNLLSLSPLIDHERVQLVACDLFSSLLPEAEFTQRDQPVVKRILRFVGDHGRVTFMPLFLILLRLKYLHGQCSHEELV